MSDRPFHPLRFVTQWTCSLDIKITKLGHLGQSLNHLRLLLCDNPTLAALLICF